MQKISNIFSFPATLQIHDNTQYIFYCLNRSNLSLYTNVSKDVGTFEIDCCDETKSYLNFPFTSAFESYTLLTHTHIDHVLQGPRKLFRMKAQVGDLIVYFSRDRRTHTPTQGCSVFFGLSCYLLAD